MAKGNVFVFREKRRKRRPGVHAKTKTSGLKSSKYYKKKYNGSGQGR